MGHFVLRGMPYPCPALPGRGAINKEGGMEKIKGYRELSQDDIDLINQAKELAVKCGDLIDSVGTLSRVDKRCLSLGKTNLQQGFMWAIRAIARPETF